jgi:phosphotransferase system IIB component
VYGKNSARQRYFAGNWRGKNIQRLENCMTRVRVEVHDDDQLDLPRLKQLSGVSGYVKQGSSIS